MKRIIREIICWAFGINAMDILIFLQRENNRHIAAIDALQRIYMDHRYLEKRVKELEQKSYE